MVKKRMGKIIADYVTKKKYRRVYKQKGGFFLHPLLVVAKKGKFSKENINKKDGKKTKRRIYN